MPEPMPIVLVPGLNCSARLYAEQIPALWRFGPVQVADHTRDDSMEAIAAGIAGSRLVVIADCGHLSTMERPNEVNAALIAWISDI